MINFGVKFSQYDNRWNTILLGYNTDPTYNINNDGCLLCDQATILEYYGIDTDPTRLNQTYKDKNAFLAGGGLYIWGSLTNIYSKVKEVKTDTPDNLTDAQMGEIKSALDAGYPVALQIDYNPKTSNLDSHYVVCVGYNPNDENDFTIFDPLGATVHSLKDYLGWFFPTARKTINQYIIYSGPIQHASTDTCLLPNTPENQKTFQNLVHGSSNWDLTVQKYLPNVDPKATDFPALQSVVGGIQSTVTDSKNKLDQALKDLATATQQVKNDEERLALSESQRQADAKTYQAQIDALSTNSDSIDKIKASYEGRLKADEDQIKQLMQDKHDMAIEIAQLKTNSLPPGLLQSLIDWLKSVLNH